VSTNREFKFVVDPLEDDGARETRWDKELTELHSQGLTIEGVGPDGDWPIRNEPDEGQSWSDFWADPTGKFIEVYNLVPLERVAYTDPKEAANV